MDHFLMRPGRLVITATGPRDKRLLHIVGYDNTFRRCFSRCRQEFLHMMAVNASRRRRARPSAALGAVLSARAWPLAASCRRKFRRKSLLESLEGDHCNARGRCHGLAGRMAGARSANSTFCTAVSQGTGIALETTPRSRPGPTISGPRWRSSFILGFEFRRRSKKRGLAATRGADQGTIHCVQ